MEQHEVFGWSPPRFRVVLPDQGVAAAGAGWLEHFSFLQEHVARCVQADATLLLHFEELAEASV